MKNKDKILQMIEYIENNLEGISCHKYLLEEHGFKLSAEAMEKELDTIALNIFEIKVLLEDG